MEAQRKHVQSKMCTMWKGLSFQLKTGSSYMWEVSSEGEITGFNSRTG